MTRQASIDAYNRIKQDGSLNQRMLEVYEILVGCDRALTAGEIFEIMRGQGRDNLVKGSISARLTDLRRLGVVDESEKRKCGFTSHKVATWIVTGRLPEKQPKPIGDAKDREIARLRAHIVELEKRLQQAHPKDCHTRLAFRKKKEPETVGELFDAVR